MLARTATRMGLLALACLGGLAAATCLPPASPESCGGCGTIDEGDLAPLGDLRVDGFVVAADRIVIGIAHERSKFAAAFVELGAAHGLPSSTITEQAALDLLVVVQNDWGLSMEGAPRIVIVHEPTCVASLGRTRDAQYRCELSTSCETSLAPTQPVACDGRCLGVCEGSCSGDLSCGLTTPTPACAGSCEGGCVLDVAGPCSGTCLGSCDDVCAQTDANGSCVGTCAGNCDGTCVLDRPDSCAGVCIGVCWVDADDPQCSGATRCRGRCEGDCDGACQGSITAPSNAAEDCESVDDCREQAAAQAFAPLECTAAAVRVEYTAAASLTAQQRAELERRVTAFEQTAATTLATTAALDLLLDGRAGAEQVVDPPPVERVVTAIIEDFAGVEHELVEGREHCLEVAQAATADRLNEAADAAANTRAAQGVLVGFLRGE
jgi:hypothetical protein